MPEITEASKHIIFEDTKDGLNIEIVDQNGRSMFPEGSKQPYEYTRKLIEKMAPALKSMPYSISITGHTAATRVPPKPGCGPWELSADRANSVREILAAQGQRVHGGGQGGQRAVVSRQPQHIAHSPRYHHSDAGSAAAPPWSQSLGQRKALFAPVNRRSFTAQNCRYCLRPRSAISPAFQPLRRTEKPQ